MYQILATNGAGIRHNPNIGNQKIVRLIQLAPNILSRKLSNMLPKIVALSTPWYASERTTLWPFDTEP
jgi:hypothetical protein